MKKTTVLLLMASLFVCGCGRDGESASAPPDLEPIEVDGKGYGFANAEGEVVIAPQFDYAAPFYEALAVVRVSGKHGAIDAKGKMVIGPQYHTLGSFSEGLASFKLTENGPGGYVDTKGKIAIAPQFLEAYRFLEGLADDQSSPQRRREYRQRLYRQDGNRRDRRTLRNRAILLGRSGGCARFFRI